MSSKTHKYNHDFWIGDVVKIRSTGQFGKVEGDEQGGTLKVKLEKTGACILVHADDLEKTEEVKTAKKVKLQQEKTDLTETINFKTEIDLHLDRLGNFHTGTWKADELSYQKHQCNKFLKKAIQLRVPKVLIIHGKGEGVLKSCVEGLLHEFSEVERTVPMNNGGAVEVWFRYI